MLTHDATNEDNVLIEWMLALECMQDRAQSKMRGIYPLMFGKRIEDDLLADEVMNRLPDIIPNKSVVIFRRVLNENNVMESQFIANRTMRGVVREIKNYLGLKV